VFASTRMSSPVLVLVTANGTHKEVSVYDAAGTLQRITSLKGVHANNGKESEMIYECRMGLRCR